MSIQHFHIKICFIFILILNGLINVFAQDTKPTPEKSKDEVLKVNTNLIQTGVTVVDKKGQFVDKLNQEDFELRIDGKPVPISFFEYTSTDKLTSTQTGNQNGEKTNNADSTTVPAAANGRKVIFILDDIHLNADSHRRTKELILRFIDRDMTPNDSAAIVSTRNKTGVIQQFTNDKAVLRAAAQRIIFSRDGSVVDNFTPPMSEYEAQLIDRGDSEVTDIFATMVVRESPSTDIEVAREQVRSRARGILSQANTVSKYTYAVLESTMRQSSQMSGRKIVFFFSDGFLLDLANTDASYQLQRITDAAVRSNAVIYSFDTKGLEAALPIELTESKPNLAIAAQPGSPSSNMDPKDARAPKSLTGVPLRTQAGARFESQDGLNLLADSTGGRFIYNTNDLQTEASKALKEASIYYLLAWEPNLENSNSEKLKRIEISVKNRPELKVRVQNGYLSAVSTALNETAKTSNELPKAAKPPIPIADEQLNSAINSQTPKLDLPTSLSANFIDTAAEGTVLATILQIKSGALDFTPNGNEATANIDLLGGIYNSEGKRELAFRKYLTINTPADKTSDRPDIFYNYQTKLKPGSYQLRVAIRDAKSGRLGSISQKIEIPDLSSRQLTVSSLLLTEQSEDTKPRQIVSEGEFALADAVLSVDRSFPNASQLRYLIFIYNAAKGAAADSLPDISIQTQILRGAQVVMTSQAAKVSVEEQEDPARLFSAADIPLDTLPKGKYELQVTVSDNTAKTKAVQRASFEIK